MVNCNLVTLDVSPREPYEMSSLQVTCYVNRDRNDFKVYDYKNILTLELWKDDHVIARHDQIVDPELRNSTRVFTQSSVSFPPDSLFVGYLGLHFVPAIRKDTGNYQCIFNSTIDNSQFNKTVYRSEPYLITVRYYPDPICSPAVNVNKGAETTVSCSVLEGTNVPVKVEWTMSANAVNLTAVSNESIVRENGSLTSNLTVVTADADINGELTCEISNTYVSKTCSIPIKTIWPSLSVNPGELVADIGSDATFTCMFQFLVNDEATWEWHTTPPIESSRSVLLADTLTIRELGENDNETTITCFALFSERWLKADAKLFVRDGRRNNLTTEGIMHTSDGDQSSGWKTGFSVVFIIMIAAVGAAAFFFWKLGKSFTCMQWINDIVTAETPMGQKPKSAVQTNTSGETYMDLQKPAEVNMSNTKSNFPQQNVPGDTYMDLRESTESKMSNKKETYRGEVNDVYENEGTEENSADSIYDYAENEDEEEQVYTNEKVIVSRYKQR